MLAPVLLLAVVGTLERRMALMLVGAFAGAIVSGAIPASVGQWTTRYAVPCVLIAAAGVRLRVLRPAPRPARSALIT